jgi:hypothetical protein
LPPSLSSGHQQPQNEDDVSDAKQWIDDSTMPLDQPLRPDQRVIPDLDGRVQELFNRFFVEATWALYRPSRCADRHGQRKRVEVNLLNPGGGVDKVSSAIEQEQRIPPAFKKATSPRPNLGECVFLPTIQRDDVLESGAVVAPSRERDRYAGGDLLLITGLQYVGAEICHSSEADVLETRPTHRKQAQRIEGTKQRGKHREDHPGASNLTTAPPGAPQGQDLIILYPPVVLEGDGYRDYFGGRVVEDDR